MLTTKGEKADIIAGLEAGANDYLAKPFDPGELRARIEVGRRMIEMQDALADKIEELRQALDQIKTLRGIVPICASCKKIRDDAGLLEAGGSLCPRPHRSRVQPRYLPGMHEDTVSRIRSRRNRAIG